MTCILFNIGAMNSHIAAVKATDTLDDNALKTASKHFQMSSGIYQYLRSSIINLLGGNETTPDLLPETLGALQALMLAQAQECFLHKAISGDFSPYVRSECWCPDNMKEGILAKVASQCEDLYGDALKQMQRDAIKSIWDKEWLPVVASKRALYGAMAQYFQSLVNKAAKDIGEELARLQHALELIKVAESKGGPNFNGKDYALRIRQAHESAQKDNDFIYHARIPDIKALTPIGKAVLARPTAMPERFSSNFNGESYSFPWSEPSAPQTDSQGLNEDSREVPGAGGDSEVVTENPQQEESETPEEAKNDPAEATDAENGSGKEEEFVTMACGGADLFSHLLPVAVQQAVQVFDVRKTDIVNTELGRLREQNQLLNAVLASLNLPAALEDVGGQALPQSIREKIQEVQEKGGAESIHKKVAELPILLERNREILQEAERLLKEEETSDNHFRSQFKDKWTRTPSEKLNSNFRTTSAKYHTILNNAMNADQSVRDKFGQYRATLELMARPQEEILAHLPSAGGVSSSATSSSSAARLRELMAEVDKLRKERELIEADVNSVAFDMKSQFLDALAQEGAINESAISSRTLDQGFKDLRQKVEDSVVRQESLVSEIQRVSEEFGKNKVPTPARDQLLKDIAAAYDAFLDMLFQLDKGTEFYGDVTHMLMEFQQRVSDFCFARRTEQEDKCRDIQQTIAGQVQKPPANMAPTA
ncbi:PDCD6IP, partial [Cordylochernes scorpioides]